MESDNTYFHFLADNALKKYTDCVVSIVKYEAKISSLTQENAELSAQVNELQEELTRCRSRKTTKKTEV